LGNLRAGGQNGANLVSFPLAAAERKMPVMDATPLPSAKPSMMRRRIGIVGWALRLVSLLIAVVVTLVALAPSIVTWNPSLRNAITRRLVGDIRGELTIEQFSVGWLEPIRIGGIKLVPIAGGSGPGTAGGETLLAVDRIESDRSLWHILTSPEDIGTIRIERPDVFIKLTDGGSNFAEVFEPITKKRKPMPDFLRYGARAKIVDGTLRGHSLENKQPWSITGINLGVGIRPASLAPSHKAEFLVERGMLLDRREISVGLCNDVFKFIAPVVADVAAAQGKVSLELDDWRLPWDDVGSGDLSGRLTMHTVEVGPGPVVQTLIRNVNAMPLVGDLYRKLELPTFVQLANESTVNFKMLPGGKIHHDNLRFSIAEVVDMRTHGEVGLDESLNLTAALGIHPPNPDQRLLALMRVLTEQDWPVKIGGTLKEPKLDLSPLNAAWKQLVFQKLPQDWQSGRGSLGANILNGVAESTGLPVDAGTVGPLLQMLGPLLKTQTARQPVTPKQSPAAAPNTPIAPQSTSSAAILPPVPEPPQPRVLIEPAAGPNVPPPPVPGVTATTPAPQLPTLPSPTATASPTSPPQPSTAAAVAEGVGIAVDVLQALRAKRQAAQQAQQTQPRQSLPPSVAPQPPNATVPPAPPPPRRPLLRAGLRMLLEAADEAASTPPPSSSATGTKAP